MGRRRAAARRRPRGRAVAPRSVESGGYPARSLRIVLAQAVNFQDGAFARLFGFQHGGADGAAPGVLLGTINCVFGKPESLAQAPGDAGILRNRADQRHRRFHRPPLDDGAFEIARHGVAQAAQDLGRRIALLLRVDHVALGEHRAAPGDARRATGARHHAPHFFHRVLHAQRLLIEERSGAGRALARAVVIHDVAAIQRMYLELSPPISNTVRTCG
jgi:hypothetical protein